MARFCPTFNQLWGVGVGLLAIASPILVGCGGLGTGEAASSYEQRLAEHLSQTNAVMYGAFWCPHCASQKELFGDAASQVPYVECDPEGENAQPELCQAKGIPGYPTWEIDGEFYTGTRSLENLAELSNFVAPE